MVIFELAQNMITDSKLRKFFGTSAVDDLFDLQKSVLELALRDMHDEKRRQLHDRVILHHYRFHQLGLNGSHFDSIKGLLVNALQTAWTDANIIEDILELLEPLRQSVYENGGRRTCCTSEDDEEFELPLKQICETIQKQKEIRRNNSGSTLSSTQSTQNKNSMKKEFRRLSGENLLSLLKLSRSKRATSAVAQ